MDGVATEIVGGGAVADLGGLERWWNDPGIAVWSFVLFGCFILNATLLLAFLIRPGLRTISNRFVMNLTVSNLLTCAILNPLLIMDAPRSPSSTDFPSSTLSGICAISEGTTALVTTSSILSVFLIAVDQYFAVVDPLRYRARVDKLKSGILIVSVWLISAVFGFLAFFNPHPRSVWLSCQMQNFTEFRNITSFFANSSLDLNINEGSALAILENETFEIESNETTESFSTYEAIFINETVTYPANTSRITAVYLDMAGESPITYGLIYAIVHSVFAYLLPFAGVCWIYVSIYYAAHRNSERTRRTGSRPILSSSASFCDEQYGAARQQQQQQQQQQQALQELSADEFRRIPKISSLSSIDETSETTQPSAHATRGRSFSSASDIERSSMARDERSKSSVVFTVGSRRIEVSPQRQDDVGESSFDEKKQGRIDGRVPTAALKAEFLEKYQDADNTYDSLVRSKFLDPPDQRRKSSHDLMYEEMIARTAARDSWMPSDIMTDGSDDSEDDARFDDFDSNSLRHPASGIDELGRGKMLSPFLGYGSSMIDVRQEKKNETLGDDCLHLNSDRELCNDMTFKPESRGKSKTLRCFPFDTRSRRSSTSSDANEAINPPKDHGDSNDNKIGKDKDIGQAPESSTCLLTPIVTITPAPNRPGTLHRVSSVRSTSSYINSLKHRISNGSLFRYREETRAARISALVIVMGLICWSPYVVLLLLKNLTQFADDDVPHEYDVLALSFLILAAYISPLLFGYRSRRVKRELRKFFCFRKELSYKNNRSLMAKKVLKRRHSSTLSHLEMDHRYNIFNCVYGRSRWPKEKVQFVQVPDTALAVETCRSSFSSGASTQISSASTEDC